ncbi:MAG: hypothetical protein QXN55_00830 [Candidatus Nitrosotenuis sp.]
MTVVSFSDAKQRLRGAIFKSPQMQQLYADAIDDVLSLWQSAISADRLNELFLSEVSPKVKLKNVENSIEDLNFLSSVEAQLGMKIVIFWPETTNSNRAGWIAGFELSEGAFATPELASENYARAFNVLLFLRLKLIISSVA